MTFEIIKHYFVIGQLEKLKGANQQGLLFLQSINIMTVQTGQRIPKQGYTLYSYQLPPPTFGKLAQSPQPVTYDDLYPGKVVVVIGIPGAFTPVCSSGHIPQFYAQASKLKELGVDMIACVSVNDAYVMEAFRKDQLAKHSEFNGNDIWMLADGNGDYTRTLGPEVDLSDKGLECVHNAMLPWLITGMSFMWAWMARANHSSQWC